MNRAVVCVITLMLLGFGCSSQSVKTDTASQTASEIFLQTLSNGTQSLYQSTSDNDAMALVSNVQSVLGDRLQTGRLLVQHKDVPSGQYVYFSVSCASGCIDDAVYVFDRKTKAFVKNDVTDLMSGYDQSPVFFSPDNMYVAILRTPLKGPQSATVIDLKKLAVVTHSDLDEQENYFHRVTDSEVAVVSPDTRWISNSDFQVAIFDGDPGYDVQQQRPPKRFLKLSTKQ